MEVLRIVRLVDNAWTRREGVGFRDGSGFLLTLLCSIRIRTNTRVMAL